MTLQIRIGFLPKPWAIKGGSFSLRPVEDFESRFKALVAGTTSNHVEFDGFFRLPASHLLEIHTDSNPSEAMAGEAGFLIHFIAWLAGTRLQFDGRWFDGNVRILPSYHKPFLERDLDEIVGRAFEVFLSTSPHSKQSALINSLFMHGMASDEHFEWKKFLYHFMALDGLLFVSGIKSRSKIGDLIELSKKYGVFLTDDKWVDAKGNKWLSCKKLLTRLLDIRNGLLHQATWVGSHPGIAVESGKWEVYAPNYLDNFVDRVVSAILLGKSDFTDSNWISLGPHPWLWPIHSQASDE